jgi:hypothetical protein
MIDVLEYIYSLLIADTELTDIVQDRIYPDIIPDKNEQEKTIPYPAIVIKRTSITREYAKGCYGETATVDITCYSVSYFEGVEMAKIIDRIMTENKHNMIAITEDFTMNAYYQQLAYTIKNKN